MEGPVHADDAEITFDRASVERHDEVARDVAAPDEDVNGAAGTVLDGLRPRRLSGGELEEVQEQIDRMRQDVEQLEVGAKRRSSVRAAPHGTERKVALDVHDTPETRKELAGVNGRRFEQKLVAGAHLQAAPFGGGENVLRALQVFREGFLDVDVAAGFECGHGDAGVGFGRGADVHHVGPVRAQDVLNRARVDRPGDLPRDPDRGGLIRIDDRDDGRRAP